MKKHLLTAVVLFFVVAMHAAVAAAAPPPRVDPSYGSNGVVDLGGSPGQATLAAAAVPDGSSFVIRVSRSCGPSSCERTLTLQRYGPRGELDTAFGGSGAVTVVETDTSFFRSGLAVDAEGRPILARATPTAIRVSRFEGNGAPDQSFGSGGQVSFPCGCKEGSVAVTVLPEGKLLLREAVSAGAGTEALILRRLQPDGGLDGSFGEGGRTELHFQSGASPSLFAPRPNGSVLFAGNSGCCATGSPVPYVSLLSARGRVVQGFEATARRALRPLSAGPSEFPEGPDPAALIARPNGRIDVVGNRGRQGLVLRLLPSGRADRSFGRKGVWRLPWSVATATRDIAGGVTALAENGGNGKVRVYRLFPGARAERRLGGAFLVPIEGVGTFNGVTATALPRGRLHLFVSGNPECRYGSCPQEARLVMLTEPPLHKRGGHA
ncbi:MAG TPA: hypothetical protein VHA54_11525 [Solirubrobacterales bacterium]|nr:hypothetical protein [Solirubrobacterales bacterium]